MFIDVVDLGSGNITSIRNLLASLNLPSKSVTKPSEISADILILPGVGSAGPYMKKLRDKAFDQAITEHVRSGKNLIGICLGFQIMTNYSEEDGEVEGLGLINGHTERIKTDNITCSHNDWEPFNFKKKSLKDSGYSRLNNLSRKQKIHGRVFYNHEYGVICNDGHVTKIEKDSLNKYTAILINKNIIGIQFHPEKSQVTGRNLMAMLL